MGSNSIISAAAKRLEGKVALITGGASGIGAATARLFAKHGAKILIADIQDDLGKAVCKDLQQISAATFVHCDVTQEPAVANAVDTAVAAYGKLDIMCNNAGINGVRKPKILDSDRSDFERIIRVNLVGAFLGTKHAARVMIPRRCGGSIISTGSICTTTGGAASYAYTSSKHGVLGLVRNAAAELGNYGIRVNCISPYLVATPLSYYLFESIEKGTRKYFSNIKGRTLMLEDVAEAALYLGSDESKYVSGHNLAVDGGFTVMNPGLCIFPQSL